MNDQGGSISLQVFNWKGQTSQSVFLTFALFYGEKTIRFLGNEIGGGGQDRREDPVQCRHSSGPTTMTSFEITNQLYNTLQEGLLD